jgi:hypothetical protein
MFYVDPAVDAESRGGPRNRAAPVFRDASAALSVVVIHSDSDSDSL